MNTTKGLGLVGLTLIGLFAVNGCGGSEPTQDAAGDDDDAVDVTQTRSASEPVPPQDGGADAAR